MSSRFRHSKSAGLNLPISFGKFHRRAEMALERSGLRHSLA